ncbi:MAG: hypothetical protein J7452_04935 [Thermoflexus sp.]|nr:hypothetical protein [Thermoflexus sp.]
MRDRYGRPVGLEDPTVLLITCGHINHFRGLNFVRQQSAALVFIHERDRRVLSNFPERLITVAREICSFLGHAGISMQQQFALLSVYLGMKSMSQSSVGMHRR